MSRNIQREPQHTPSIPKINPKMKGVPFINCLKHRGVGVCSGGMLEEFPSWCFQPIWKILVKIGSSSPNRDENKKSLKPPPRWHIHPDLPSLDWITKCTPPKYATQKLEGYVGKFWEIMAPYSSKTFITAPSCTPRDSRLAPPGCANCSSNHRSMESAGGVSNPNTSRGSTVTPGVNLGSRWWFLRGYQFWAGSLWYMAKNRMDNWGYNIYIYLGFVALYCFCVGYYGKSLNHLFWTTIWENMLSRNFFQGSWPSKPKENMFN